MKKTKDKKLNAVNPDVGTSAVKLLKQLRNAQLKLDGLQGDMAALIQQVTDVEEVSVFWQGGDGFVVCDSNANNAPLSKCIAIIRDKGKLTWEDYKNVTI